MTINTETRWKILFFIPAISYCICKSMLYGIKTCIPIFIILMLLPVYFAPAIVAELFDKHGFYIIAKPLFIQWLDFSLFLTTYIIGSYTVFKTTMFTTDYIRS